MTPTLEQKLLVQAALRDENMKVLAFAGAGKTSSLKLLAHELDDRRGLYLAFNRRNADEAKRDFPPRVDSRSTHSLAYRGVNAGQFRSKLNTRMMSGELIHSLALEGYAGLSAYAAAARVKDTLRRYCYSADSDISLQHVPLPLDDRVVLRRTVESFTPVEQLVAAKADPGCEHAKKIQAEVDSAAKRWKAYILSKAQQAWPQAIDPHSTMPMEHDYYLKLFQLGKPHIRGVDYIMLDEAQDTNDCVLDILMRQAEYGTQVVIVGDPYQAIYGWRGAVNALDESRTPGMEGYWLSQSFRFGEAIAELANAVLAKSESRPDVALRGNPGRASVIGNAEGAPHAIIARSNAGVMAHAFELLYAGREFAVVGGTRDLADEIESVYWLSRDRPSGVVSPSIKVFKTFDELLAEAQHDYQLQRIVELANDLGAETPEVADKLRDMNSNSQRDCDIVLSTAHKSKGLEWSSVILADDFCKWRPDDFSWADVSQEEINILYVAMTRALDRLQPNQLLQEMIDG